MKPSAFQLNLSIPHALRDGQIQLKVKGKPNNYYHFWPDPPGRSLPLKVHKRENFLGVSFRFLSKIVIHHEAMYVFYKKVF